MLLNFISGVCSNLKVTVVTHSSAGGMCSLFWVKHRVYVWKWLQTPSREGHNCQLATERRQTVITLRNENCLTGKTVWKHELCRLHHLKLSILLLLKRTSDHFCVFNLYNDYPYILTSCVSAIFHNKKSHLNFCNIFIINKLICHHE